LSEPAAQFLEPLELLSRLDTFACHLDVERAATYSIRTVEPRSMVW
jgi:hypothetical protein